MDRSASKKDYIKKLDVQSEHSSPEERAKRLRRLRNLANLSRKEMCAGCNLNVNTLKGWELARFGGLPKDGATKVIDRIAQEGVQCSVEWLLYGEGLGPQLTPQINIADHSKTILSQITKHDDSELLKAELSLFCQHHPNSLYCEIMDDAMAPHYQQGDLVAGVIIEPKKYHHYFNQNCIVQLSDEKILLRNFKCKLATEDYMLISTNPNTTVMEPIIHQAFISHLAVLLWHRRPSSGDLYG